MKTAIMAKRTTTNHKVNACKNEMGNFQSRPILLTDVKIEGWDVYSETNEDLTSICLVTVDEEKTVCVERRQFNSVMNRTEIFVNFVMLNTDVGKEEAEKQLADLLLEYNKETILHNARMKAYCEISGLDPATTDADKLKLALGIVNQLKAESLFTGAINADILNAATISSDKIDCVGIATNQIRISGIK
jgi:hypothetical protein